MVAEPHDDAARDAGYQLVVRQLLELRTDLAAFSHHDAACPDAVKTTLRRLVTRARELEPDNDALTEVGGVRGPGLTVGEVLVVCGQTLASLRTRAAG